MNLREFQSAVEQIAEEKDLPREIILDTVEQAIAAAYKKEYGRRGQKILVTLNPKNFKAQAFLQKQIVKKSWLKDPEQVKSQEKEAEEFELLDKKKKPKLLKGEIPKEEQKDIRFKSQSQILLTTAKKLVKKAKAGNFLLFPLKVKEEFGRIAAQTAKQVIIQKIREAERDLAFKQYHQKQGTIISGIVQRVEKGMVYLDLGKASGVLPPSEQIPGEYYSSGQRLKVYVLKVEKGPKGPVIFPSRATPQILKEMFRLEVPEIASGVVEIKAIAREPGSRSKIAVTSHEQGVDPIGACIGQKGGRIATIINEFNGEKIDIVEWSDDPKVFIAKALSPAKVLEVETDKKAKIATAWVAADQQSLAIGKKGQNVRLAAKLTGWKIDVKLKKENA